MLCFWYFFGWMSDQTWKMIIMLTSAKLILSLSLGWVCQYKRNSKSKATYCNIRFFAHYQQPTRFNHWKFCKLKAYCSITACVLLITCGLMSQCYLCLITGITRNTGAWDGTNNSLTGNTFCLGWDITYTLYSSAVDHCFYIDLVIFYFL